MDSITPERRSKNMSAIRSKNTGPEIYLRKLLFSMGYRYRICAEGIPGHPDIWLSKYNAAVFVHGCFWHRHEGCRFTSFPKTRVDFWQAKFDANVHRDQIVREQLADCGIRQLIVWECAIRTAQKTEEAQQKLLWATECFIRSNKAYEEIDEGIFKDDMDGIRKTTV